MRKARRGASRPSSTAAAHASSAAAQREARSAASAVACESPKTAMNPPPSRSSMAASSARAAAASACCTDTTRSATSAAGLAAASAAAPWSATATAATPSRTTGSKGSFSRPVGGQERRGRGRIQVTQDAVAELLDGPGAIRDAEPLHRERGLEAHQRGELEVFGGERVGEAALEEEHPQDAVVGPDGRADAGPDALRDDRLALREAEILLSIEGEDAGPAAQGGLDDRGRDSRRGLGRLRRQRRQLAALVHEQDARAARLGSSWPGTRSSRFSASASEVEPSCARPIPVHDPILAARHPAPCPGRAGLAPRLSALWRHRLGDRGRRSTAAPLAAWRDPGFGRQVGDVADDGALVGEDPGRLDRVQWARSSALVFPKRSRAPGWMVASCTRASSTKVPFRLSRSTTHSCSPRRSNSACMLEIHGSATWTWHSGERPRTVGTSGRKKTVPPQNPVHDEELGHGFPLGRSDGGMIAQRSRTPKMPNCPTCRQVCDEGSHGLPGAR